jgi:hypothetical protein
MMRCDWARDKGEHMLPEAHIIAELNERSKTQNQPALIMPSMDSQELADQLRDDDDKESQVIIIEL